MKILLEGNKFQTRVFYNWKIDFVFIVWSRTTWKSIILIERGKQSRYKSRGKPIYIDGLKAASSVQTHIRYDGEEMNCRSSLNSTPLNSINPRILYAASKREAVAAE